MMERPLQDGVPAAGLFAGAAAWFVSTQLNYALVPWLCATGMNWLTPVCFAMLMAVSLAGGFLSWRAWGKAGVTGEDGDGHPQRFLAGIGILAAALFALVIASQGSAGFVLQGCER